jgi:hypothetical protein
VRAATHLLAVAGLALHATTPLLRLSSVWLFVWLFLWRSLPYVVCSLLAILLRSPVASLSSVLSVVALDAWILYRAPRGDPWGEL